ncbi:hypothetical protein LCGC14_1940740 [marine sediment metagenome]|uniref:Uncharacterized protein n=1 Tax=marine sediment metagenome TaxID=412755 RepID=A0A0F9IHS2_9ZZZZ
MTNIESQNKAILEKWQRDKGTKAQSGRGTMDSLAVRFQLSARREESSRRGAEDADKIRFRIHIWERRTEKKREPQRTLRAQRI